MNCHRLRFYNAYCSAGYDIGRDNTDQDVEERVELELLRGYKLPARLVIHTVSLVWQGSHADEDNLLASCYRSVVKVAAKCELHSPAFASLNAVRLLRAAQTALQEPVREIWTGLRANFQLEWTKAVCFSDGDPSVYQDALQTEAR